MSSFDLFFLFFLSFVLFLDFLSFRSSVRRLIHSKFFMKFMVFAGVKSENGVLNGETKSDDEKVTPRHRTFLLMSDDEVVESHIPRDTCFLSHITEMSLMRSFCFESQLGGKFAHGFAFSLETLANPFWIRDYLFRVSKLFNGSPWFCLFICLSVCLPFCLSFS